jgi:membrane protein YqaA with SNARE-associated domain
MFFDWTAVSEFLLYLIKNYGYFGVLISSFITSATIIIPLPTHVFIFAFGTLLNPFLVGLSAGVGSTLGEFTGYLIGKGGNKLLETKYEKKIKQLERGFDKWGAYFIIFGAATPFPFDIIGIFCGSINYNVRKFLVATFIGKTLIFILIAAGGSSAISLLGY